MNKLRYILLAFLLSTVIVGCKKSWLDVNIDPNTPSNTTAAVRTRLPWVQHYFLYAQGTAGVRASLITQQILSIVVGSHQSEAAGWNPIAGMSTTPYQFFFVGSAANIQDLIDKAEAEQAYHYIGAAKAIRAMGFMLMTDWYGEMPYTEALGAAVTPKFDDGKTIFEGCLKEIDEAIEYFKMIQPATATPLSAGDSWNNGDVNKWIKLCYGLKARWLNNLSKKSSLYNPDAILDALSKAPLSNAEGTVINHEDVKENSGDVLFSDPLKTSIVFNNIAMNENFRVTKWFVDILTNFDGRGVEDPRADKLIPWAQFGTPKEFVRSQGVDMTSPIRFSGKGPVRAEYNAKDDTIRINNNTRVISAHSWYVSSSDPARWGDTVYVSLKSSSIGYNGDVSDIYTFRDGTVGATGTFYSRPDAPTYLLTYAEMCFIKAEVLFKRGDKAGAFNAYKEGILANINLMNSKLATYGNVNPSKSPMTQDKIDAFITNGIGTASDITLKKIMTQKYIAMAYSQQNWNDMRRYDYSPEVYQGWAVPYEYLNTAAAQIKIPLGKYFRRVRQVSHEINYNSANVAASHPNALSDDIWSFPVWWDTNE